MIAALGVVLFLAIVLPHVLHLQRCPPLAGATVWMSALLLRALTAILAVVYVIAVLPTTELFDAVVHECWHTVLPLVATQFALHGHALWDVAVLLPASLVAASFLSISYGVWKATRAVRRLVRGATVGEGPRKAVIVGDRDVLVASAGLRRPRVLVSVGALISFDDEELDASLEHEAGHIAHMHRYVFVFAELCRALGRFLPGTRVAARELAIHLERDADRFAIERRHQPVVLASAIFKAATYSPVAPVVAPVVALGGGGVARRIDELLDVERLASRSRGRSVRLLAALMASLGLALSLAIPSITLAAMESSRGSSVVRHCID